MRTRIYKTPPPEKSISFPVYGKRGVTSVCLHFLGVGVQSACDHKEGSIDSKIVVNNVMENRVYQA